MCHYHTPHLPSCMMSAINMAAIKTPHKEMINKFISSGHFSPHVPHTKRPAHTQPHGPRPLCFIILKRHKGSTLSVGPGREGQYSTTYLRPIHLHESQQYKASINPGQVTPGKHRLVVKDTSLSEHPSSMKQPMIKFAVLVKKGWSVVICFQRWPCIKVLPPLLNYTLEAPGPWVVGASKAGGQARPSLIGHQIFRGVGAGGQL